MSSYLYQEKELLLQVAAGDELAFGRLMEQYHPAAYGTVMRLLQDPWLAEDVVQEVFLKVWLSRSSLTDIDSFRSWLISITTNKVYDLIRKHNRESVQRQQWQKELHLPDNTGMREATDYEELLEQALVRLSPRQQTVFTHLKKEGYSREETARLMNISPETVKSHLEQAMRHIRAYCMSRLDTFSFLVISSLLKDFF